MLKIIECKRKCHAKINCKKANVTTLISEKVDFKTSNIAISREGHFIMIKWSIHKEYITVLTVYMPNNRRSSICNKN